MNEKRVLIIDDDTLVRRALADYLSECGYMTSTAQDGAQGLTQAQTEAFHVVLVDLRMPGVDGLQVITTLKAEQPKLPLVVVSGTGVLHDAVEAQRRGAWDYVTKPIQDMNEVVIVIERVLEKVQLTAERDRYHRELEDLNHSLEAEVARQTQDLRTHIRELEALNRVSYAISAPLDIDTMLNRAIDAAIDVIEADYGALWLLNPDTNQVVVAATRGLRESSLAPAQAIPLGQGIVGRVAQNGHPLGGSDLADDSWLAALAPPSPPQAGGIEGGAQAGGIAGGQPKAKRHSYLCVPLRSRDEILGTLGVALQTTRDFGSHEVKLLSAIGNQIGVAVARTQNAAKLERANVRLEQGNIELRRLDTLREQFIQNVAHELRTPLGLVHGYIEILAQGGLNPDEQQAALTVTSQRVQELVDLVKSITTIEDLSNQPLRIETIAPAKLLQTAIQMSWQRAMIAGIKLHQVCLPDLPCFSGDFGRLAQTLDQLLDNACKFSSQGSTVTVRAWTAQDALLISVADQGIGIPPEEHDHIFERFYQVDGSARRRYGGTGMGLALAKEIVEAHGGRITLRSVKGEGSTFTVCLPLQ